MVLIMTTFHRRFYVFLGIILGVFLLVWASFFGRSVPDRGIVVGGKDIEGKILGEIIAQLIEKETEIPVRREFHFDGTFIIFQAFLTKQIDLYVEYSGTVMEAILKKKGLCQEEIRQGLLEKCDGVWMEGLGFENRYGVMMDPEVAKKWGIETFSDLKGHAKKGELRFAFDPEFVAREEWGLIHKVYGVAPLNLKLMDHTLLYLTIDKGGCDVINGYTTDGLCSGLKILVDDQGILPSYEATPLVRRETLEKYPELKRILKKMEGKISQEEMQAMNYAVEKKGESFYDVANAFLKQHYE